MTITISTDLRAARNATTLTVLDAGGVGHPAYAEIRDLAEALLVVLTFAFPAGAVESDGRIALAIGEAVMAVGSGVPATASVYNGSGTALWQCSASMSGGGGDIEIAISGGSGTQIYAGGLVQFAGGTLG